MLRGLHLWQRVELELCDLCSIFGMHMAHNPLEKRASCALITIFKTRSVFVIKTNIPKCRLELKKIRLELNKMFARLSP